MSKEFVEVGGGEIEGQIEQHIYHHSDRDGCTFNVKIEKNSRGLNWELTVIGARSADEARQARDEAMLVIKELIEQESVQEEKPRF